VETADVVIAGAGIIGLSLALDLAAHSLKVTVLERGRTMTESSWAAAGMLAANDPENPQQLHQLAQFSLREYPNWLAQIENLSGRQVPFRTTQTLQGRHPAAPSSSVSRLSTRDLSVNQLHTLVPNLHLNGPAADQLRWLLLDESSLDPRDLCSALPLAAKAAGIRIIENSPVLSIDTQPVGVLIQTPTTPIAAAHFVNCAGAWAESPALGRLPRHHPRIAPRKGQMTAVRLRGRDQLSCVLRTSEIYLVPRGDRTVVVGATVEHAGFDKTVEPHAIARLLKTAAQLWPPIADAEILESWAGLRPGSADDLPLIGPLEIATTEPRLWIAAGHFRNGILLAPATAPVLSQAIRGIAPEADLSPFEPGRFRPLDRIGLAASDKPAIPAL
jgi:glycine oxidase